MVATRKPRIDPQTALDLLARQMWIADKLAQASDEVPGIQAVEEWDDDRLLTDTYEKYETRAREAIRAAMQEANGA